MELARVVTMDCASRPYRSGASQTRRRAKLWPAQDGATAVEFALVATPFFLVVGTIVELGLMSFTQHQLQHAVGQASREIRTGQTLTVNAFRDEICNRATMIANCTTSIGLEVQSSATFAGLSAPDLNTISATAVPVFNPGTAGQAVSAVATFDWEFSLPLMYPMGNISGKDARRLYGMAVFKNEP